MQNKPGCLKGQPGTAPHSNGVTPKDDGTISRQVVRRMLRDKAKKDVQQQYGRAVDGATGVRFVGYLEFPRRARRRVQMRMQKRWFHQIREQAAVDPGQARNRGFVKSIMRKLFGGQENTLAASGVRR